jgi:hypothetical protein
MRADPRSAEEIGKVGGLCDEFEPGMFVLVATAP